MNLSTRMYPLWLWICNQWNFTSNNLQKLIHLSVVFKIRDIHFIFATFARCSIILATWATARQGTPFHKMTIVIRPHKNAWKRQKVKQCSTFPRPARRGNIGRYRVIPPGRNSRKTRSNRRFTYPPCDIVNNQLTALPFLPDIAPYRPILPHPILNGGCGNRALVTSCQAVFGQKTMFRISCKIKFF